jgi:hypothetical protein
VVCAQPPNRESHPQTASISGSVIVNGKAAPNATVTVTQVDDYSSDGRPIEKSGSREGQEKLFFKGKTDGDGRYLIGGPPAGKYIVRTLSGAYIVPGRTINEETARGITLDEGEARRNLDFELVRGGVISGRLTDADGRPMIGRRVRLLRWHEEAKKYFDHILQNGEMTEADDRGVYRIYGLFAGRYLVCAGGINESGSPGLRYLLTYHPGVTEVSEAGAIEIGEGDEVTNANITLGDPIKTYEASGRVIDAETGRPLPQIYVYCSSKADGQNQSGNVSSSVQTDYQGYFRFANLPSLSYELYLSNPTEKYPYYSERIAFEIGDANVSGLELKAVRGGNISGIVVVEGGEILSKRIDIQRVPLTAIVQAVDGSVGPNTPPRYLGSGGTMLKSDGSFQLKGLPPGKVFFRLEAGGEAPRVRQVLRDGLEMKGGLVIRQGENVTNVRIVLTATNGAIRGQVRFIGGPFPTDYTLEIIAERPGSRENRGERDWFNERGGSAEADEKGRFFITGLAPGEYELMLLAIKKVLHPPYPDANVLSDKHTVKVTAGAETTFNFTIDLSRKNQQREQ